MEQLNIALAELGTAGFVLSTEHRAALSSSLVILKSNEKFESVVFWGTVVGTSGTYYIAQGLGKSQLGDRKSFYTQDCVTWAQLPAVHPVIVNSSKKIKKRFTGTASHEFLVQEPGPSADEAPVDLPADVALLRKEQETETGVTITTTITEEKRLAALVEWIDHDCATVPRGAFIKTAAGEVAPAQFYKGLSPENAGKLSSYLHFRKSEQERSPLERAKIDKTTDFLDALIDDVPKGSWTLQHGSGGSSVLVKSLIWPGFTFFHAPNTDRHGYIYNGIGQRNADLAFMLPN